MESSQLATSTGSYGAVNATIEENEPEGNPIKQLYREVRSGKQRLGWVTLFSVIAAVGACLNGFMLGFTSLLVINMDKFHYPEESGQNIQYIGVRLLF